MQRFFSLIYVLYGILLVTACSDDQGTQIVQLRFQSIDTSLLSRGVDIAVTVTTPVVEVGETFPLVVMAHGHGGSRHEGGGYVQLAEKLALLGMASIRMDFPGCGDSTESFANNNLTNMLADLKASRTYADAIDGVDTDRVGLLGFSMGGRLAALLSEIDSSYKAMVLWAPAVANGADRENMSFGGPEIYAALKKTAIETGGASYTTSYGQNLVLGPGYFRDIEESTPLQAIEKYTGPILVLYGDQDAAVPPAISESAISAATSSSEVIRHVLPGVGHDLGIYSNLEDVAADVINTSAEFLQQRL